MPKPNLFLMIRILFLYLCFISIAYSQTNNSVLTAKYEGIYNLCDDLYKKGESKTLQPYCFELLDLAQKINNDSLTVVANRMIGNSFYLMNDYISAIDYYTYGIDLAEKAEITTLLPKLYNNVGFNYNKLGYYTKSLGYLKKGKEIAEQGIDTLGYIYILENLSRTSLHLEKPHEAKSYLEIANKLNKSNNESYIEDYIQASIYLDYALVYKKTLNFGQAEHYFEKAIKFSIEKQDTKHLSETQYEYAKFQSEQKKYPEARKNAEESLALAKKNDFIDIIIADADLLSKIHEELGNLNQAFVYAKLLNETNTILTGRNNKSQIENALKKENVKEVQAETELKKIEDERKRYVEYFIIAIVIIVLVTTFMILSNSIIVNGKFVSYVGKIGLLIVFEFINMVIHPWLEKVTHHSSFLMLLILVLIASLLVRLHHKLDAYVQTQLVEKNREARIVIAKKIIEQAEIEGQSKNGW